MRCRYLAALAVLALLSLSLSPARAEDAFPAASPEIGPGEDTVPEAGVPADVMESALPLAFPGETLAQVNGDTISFSIDRWTVFGAECYLTRVTVADPARQITKRTAAWREGLAHAADLCAGVPRALLCINASGYVSPVYSWIPESYPGTNSDYYYTPLGSLTVTGGEVYRDLKGVPYYGLTLEEDGLHLYNGEDNEAVLSRGVIETWSFYEQCPMIVDGQCILPGDWSFAHARAGRNILCMAEDGSCVILTVPSRPGLSLFECADFLLAEVRPLWAYDLDGGPSTALLYRTDTGDEWTSLCPNRQKNVDIIAFTE